jgi:class 3 adenylate cyclase/tetratricopeptide (TPR) repeat protein
MRCETCSADNPGDARFCHNCGSILEPSRPVEGERKLVTVLFADVVDSTAIAERLDPEHFAEIMNGAFAFMSAAIARYGGTVARLMGDAVLAFFGAPTAHEDDAERAIRAGLEIRADAREYARMIELRHGIEFRVRVGIHTGLVVVGEVGTAAHTEYTAMGETTNVAARLQSRAEPGTVLISASTHRLVRRLFDVTSLGKLTLKGRSAPIAAYQVVEPRVGPGSSRGIEGMTSPLVGRDEELGLLQARISALTEGRGALVLLAGEAGLGKSRLVAEARSGPAGHATRWLEGRALSYSQSSAYSPWRQVIRQVAGVPEGEAPARIREKLRDEWHRRAAPPDDLPFLEALLGVESEEGVSVVTALEGDVLVRRIADSIRDCCRALAEEQPTALVFDDLHWADSASLDLILEIADLSESTPLLLLCLLRPDKGSPGWSLLERARSRLQGRVTEIHLAPLSVDHSRRLLANLLDVEGLPDPVRDLVLHRSEGNPFFLEEVLRSFVDSGHILRRNGHWATAREITAVVVPETLVGVLSARIDNLPEETKRVVQTAAVIGRIFGRRALTEVCAAAPSAERVEDVGPHLERLTYEELIRERAGEPEQEYIFKHALTQQAAYDLLLVKRRKELHRRAAVVLEALHPERSDEIAALLAHHFLRAEEWEQATEQSRRAGTRAARLYALTEALDHLENAVAAATRLEAVAPLRLVDVILEWTFVVYSLRLHEIAEQRETVLRRLGDAERITRELGDRARLARSLVWQGNLLMLAGFPGTSFERLREGYEIAVDLGDEELALLPLFAMTWLMVDIDPRAALPRLEKVIADARRYTGKPGSKELEAHALAVLGLGHARLGEFDAAEQAVRQALELAPYTRSPIKEADVDLTAAWVYYEMGDIERGLQYSRTGTELALSINGMECACTGTWLLGVGQLQMRNLQEALRAFEASSSMAAPLGTGMESEKVRIHASLAYARLIAGEPEALADLEERLRQALALSDAFGVAYISQMLGDAYAESGSFDRAHERLAAALEHYRKMGMRPAAARVLRSIGAVYDRQHLTAEAEEAHAEADAIQKSLRSPSQSPADPDRGVAIGFR